MEGRILDPDAAPRLLFPSRGALSVGGLPGITGIKSTAPLAEGNVALLAGLGIELDELSASELLLTRNVGCEASYGPWSADA
jgi:hypothetical protein